MSNGQQSWILFGQCMLISGPNLLNIQTNSSIFLYPVHKREFLDQQNCRVFVYLKLHFLITGCCYTIRIIYVEDTIGILKIHNLKYSEEHS